MVSGHRRIRACELAGIEQVPAIVRDLNRDEAIIIMVDSNLQREKILPSERAKAYQMKLDALRRKAGRPTKENSAQVELNFHGKTSIEVLAEDSPDSRPQIQRLIRLNSLEENTASLHESEKALALCQQEAEAENQKIKNMAQQFQNISAWAEQFDHADVETKKMILARIIERITIGKGYEIHIRFFLTKEDFMGSAEAENITISEASTTYIA